MSATHFFSKDYFQARDRFIKSINELKGQGHQVSHDVLTLDCKGPNQENLCIYIETIGSIDSDNLLLYSSGIHGVEGFAGSAIQLSVLDQLKNVIPITDYCIVFVHINIIFIHPPVPCHTVWINDMNKNDAIVSNGARIFDLL